MLSSRLQNLIATSAAYFKYGVLLLTDMYNKPIVLEPCDDLGVFIYIPIISKFFNIDPVCAANMFFIGISGLFFIATSIAFLKLSKTYMGYGVVLFGVWQMVSLSQRFDDVYLAYMVAFLGVSLVLLALEKKSKKLYWFSFFVTGLVAGFSNIVRVHAALPVIVFLVIIVFFDHVFDTRKKCIAIGLCILGFAMPYGHLQYLIHQRDVFIKEHGDRTHVDYISHPTWHNFYIGFGFLSNPYGIVYDDACGEQHATALEPKLKNVDNLFTTQLYSDTIKKLVINLVKKDRYFVVKTLFAKTGVILFFFLLYFGWLGLLAAYFVPKPWYIECAFVCAAGASAVPGILTAPETAIIMGFITCTVMYMTYSLIWFFNHDGLKKVTLACGSLLNKKKK